MTAGALGARAIALAFAVAAAGLPASPARAQALLAIVNNQAITSFDVDQRIRIAALTERRRLDRKAALTELVDDQVKVIEARRIGYRINDEGVETEYGKLAKSNRMSTREFGDALERSGVQPNALRAKLRADLAWQVLLRDQARRGSQVTSAEIDSALEEKRRATGTITEYRLQQVVFIVPRGAPNVGERLRAANAARASFTSCETGFDDLRQIKDVAFKPAVVRTSADLAKPLQQVIDKTPVGRLTPPSQSNEGIEMVAVCSRTDLKPDAVQRSSVASDIAEKRIIENAKTYLAELRKKVDIRYR